MKTASACTPTGELAEPRRAHKPALALADAVPACALVKPTHTALLASSSAATALACAPAAMSVTVTLANASNAVAGRFYTQGIKMLLMTRTLSTVTSV